MAPDRARVGVQQAGADQFADQERHAAGRLEVVHVRFAVGIDAGQQRRDLGQIGKIVPGQRDPRRRRHRDEMDRQIGRAAGGVEADDAVDDRALVDHMADRREFIAERAQRQRALGAERRQRVAQRRVGIDERGAGQMQAHDLHQHLIGVGGAIEGAGARPVIGARFGGEQFLAARLALGVALANLRLFFVAEARGHRPGGQEDRRQMAERQRADQQAGHDLVADAKKHRRVEHLVRQRDAGRQRDDVAREQRQLHARFALGDAVAHRRHAAGDLRRRADLARRRADQLGKPLERLMGGEHVVIGGDDGEVRPAALAQGLPCRPGPQAAKPWAKLAQPSLRRAGPLATALVDALKIGAPRRAAALDDALGDLADAGVEGRGHDDSFEFGRGPS